jgi:hypothetical protein
MPDTKEGWPRKSPNPNIVTTFDPRFDRNTRQTVSPAGFSCYAAVQAGKCCGATNRR